MIKYTILPLGHISNKSNYKTRSRDKTYNQASLECTSPSLDDRKVSKITENKVSTNKNKNTSATLNGAKSA
jgi:hypothetical protein